LSKLTDAAVNRLPKTDDDESHKAKRVLAGSQLLEAKFGEQRGDCPQRMDCEMRYHIATGLERSQLAGADENEKPLRGIRKIDDDFTAPSLHNWLAQPDPLQAFLSCAERSDAIGSWFGTRVQRLRFRLVRLGYGLVATIGHGN
jgi:hypothetical protein